MKEGKTIQQGTPETIYHNPVNEYVAGMFGKYNLLNSEQAAMFGIDANGKDVMIRPEEFFLNRNDGVKGLIEKLSFWGSFYEVEVLVGESKIVVRVMKNEWEVGEKVYVQNKPNNLCSKKLFIT